MFVTNPQPGSDWVEMIEGGWRNSVGDQDTEIPLPFSGISLAHMRCHQKKESGIPLST